MKKIVAVGSACLAIFSIVCALDGCSPVQKKPKSYIVEIKDMKFVPEDITVNKGDTITWINHDMVPHDVTEETTKSWTSGKLEVGSSWKMAVNADAHYYCSIHEVMKGKIELE